ncbi:MAG TPA: xanthine dehydrogenase family protein molybdopterin-binding subunit [Burkholderiales bacterium]|nr:xanthine dehydrogenase family protein molybdopterin-binding subunit [Burkholderiales bacterium]
MTAQDKFVGAAIERIEDLRLLTGNGRYVDDIHRPGMLHAVIVRSSAAHGLIRGIDTAAAAGMPGVHAVYTGRDIAAEGNGRVPTIPLRLAPLPELEAFEQNVIALDKVRYVGECLAVVVAETQAQAEDAAAEVNVEIEALPAVPDCEAAARDKSLLFAEHGTNAVITYVARKGDAQKAVGPYVRKETFGVQRHSAVTMETRGLVAEWDGERLTVLGAAKVPFSTRAMLAPMLNLPPERIDMIESDVGGGFGVRGEFYPENFLVPFAARRLKRPVKWVEDRRENLLGSNHSREMQCELEIVCASDGRVLALLGAVSVDCGAYMRANAAVPPRNVAQFLSGPYDVPNIHVESTVYLTSKAPIGTYRGPGRFEADFFRERLFDMAARDLGIDPVEFRRINLVKAGQMPYPLATVDQPEKREELDSGDYRAALERCLAEFDWDAKRALQGRLVDGKYHGIAVGCFIEGGAAGPKETARIEIEEDGSITVYAGSTNVGQGVVTVLTQIAADALDVPLERIRVLHGSTTYLKEGYGSYHSRATVMGGSAVLNAATALKERIREAAATEHRWAAGEVQIGPGLTASFRGQMLTAAQLGQMKVQADGEFANHHHTYAYGTAAAHVTVDPGTGRIELVDYFTVEDVGRVINPLTARGQIVGAVVQGLGGALLEHLAYDGEGQFLAGTLADYLMPAADDFPCIRALVLGNSPSPHNPLGAKGGGEGGIVPVGGVIANAVAAALASLKVEPKTLPLTPPRIWALIHG